MNGWKRKTYLILEIPLIFTTDSYKSVKLFESSKVNINANEVLFLKKSTPSTKKVRAYLVFGVFKQVQMFKQIIWRWSF